MLTVRNQKGVFNLRVAGVMRKDDKILLLNEPLVGSYWFLPGGRAEMHESTDEALRRELAEEMNGPVVPERLIWVIENFYTMNHVPHHVIGFYYTARLPEDHLLARENELVLKRHEDGVVKTFHFKWHGIDELTDIDLRPPCLKPMLATIPSGENPCHFVSRQPS